jgi:hypothetical protein
MTSLLVIWCPELGNILAYIYCASFVYYHLFVVSMSAKREIVLLVVLFIINQNLLL